MLVPGALNAMMISSGGSAVPVPVPAVDYGGVSDFLATGVAWSGTADGPLGMINIWVRIDAGDGTTRTLITDNNQHCELKIGTNNKFLMTLQDAAQTKVFSFGSNTAYTAGATWLNLLMGWNTNAGAAAKTGYFYVNDASDVLVTSDASTAFSVDYSGTNNAIAARTNGATPWDGCISQPYINIVSLLDFSATANRRSFISAAGKPINLGANGSLPTGAQPIVFLPNPFGTVGMNAGYGGNYAINGAPTNCSTAPSG